MQKLSAFKASACSLALLFGTAILSACGGGSSSSSTDDSSPQNPAPQNPAPQNSAPQILQLTLLDANGDEAFAGDVLTASYQYVDLEEDAEGETKIRWLRDDEIITGAHELSYTLTADDLEKDISIEVQAIALTGEESGEFSQSNSLHAYDRKYLPLTQVSNSEDDYELWQLSGSGKLTLVKDINSDEGSWINEIFEFGDKVLFAVNDGIHGTEVWVSDGTAEGSSLLKDIYPGANSSVSIYQSFHTFDGLAYFSADDGEHGVEIWVTDGTSEGTRLLKETNSSGMPRVELNGQLLFSLDDGIHGRELWRTDGTPEGTQLVKDVREGSDSGIYSTYNSSSLLSNGEMYFVTSTYNNTTEIWKTDGTEEGTKLVAGLTNTVDVEYEFTTSNIVIIPNKLCMFVTKTQVNESITSYPFYCLNEAGDNIEQVNLGVEMKARHSSYISGSFEVVGDKIYMLGVDENNKKGLYVTDGTPLGTWLLTEDNEISNFSKLYEFNGRQLIYVRGSTEGLWQTDGSLENTVLLKSGLSPAAFREKEPLVINDNLIFLAEGNDSDVNSGIWMTNGTAEGTLLIKGIRDTSGTDYANYLFRLENKMYFYLGDFENLYSHVLMESDGTAEGTKPVTQENSTFSRRYIK
jgi:ELWxxDGT repeat protein